MKKGLFLVMVVLTGCLANHLSAISDVYLTNDAGVGEKIGQVHFRDTSKGLAVKVDLKNLPPGEHGFHIHENPSCQPLEKNGKLEPALAAGGHFDPDHTGKHLGPHGHGHRGDMPALMVDENGMVKTEFFLQNLTVKDVENRSLIVHAGGDNYSDEPLPLGGGGARIACGVIKEKN